MDFNVVVNAGECDAAPIADKADLFLGKFGRRLIAAEQPCPLLLERLLNDKDIPDACAYAPMWLQPLSEAGKIADLTELCADDAVTTLQTKEGLEGDFFSSYLDYAAWADIKNRKPGRGRESSLIALPGTHTGATLLFYRRDVFEHLKIKVPETWEEFNEAAKKLHLWDGKMAATSLCLDHNGQPPVTDWFNRFSSRGGKHAAESKACAFSEQGVAAYEDMLHLMDYMPADQKSFTEADCLKAFAQGRAAMVLNVTSFAFPSLLYSEECSLSREQIGVAPIPGENGFAGVGYGGGWSWMIPSRAKDKILSWQAIQFFSSKEVDAYRCIRYGTTPVRLSTTTDPIVRAAQPWVEAAGEVIGKAVAPEYFHSPKAELMMAEVSRILDSGLRSRQNAASVLKEIDKCVAAHMDLSRR